MGGTRFLTDSILLSAQNWDGIGKLGLVRMSPGQLDPTVIGATVFFLGPSVGHGCSGPICPGPNLPKVDSISTGIKNNLTEGCGSNRVGGSRSGN